AAELQFAQSELSARKQETQYRKSREQIREKLGLTPEEFDSLYPDVRIFRDPPARPQLAVDDLLSAARRQRPDWRRTRADIRRSEIAAERARARLLPQLALRYNHQWTRSDEHLEPALADAIDYRSRLQTIG